MFTSNYCLFLSKIFKRFKIPNQSCLIEMLYTNSPLCAVYGSRLINNWIFTFWYWEISCLRPFVALFGNIAKKMVCHKTWKFLVQCSLSGLDSYLMRITKPGFHICLNKNSVTPLIEIFLNRFACTYSLFLVLSFSHKEKVQFAHLLNSKRYVPFRRTDMITFPFAF